MLSWVFQTLQHKETASTNKILFEEVKPNENNFLWIDQKLQAINDILVSLALSRSLSSKAWKYLNCFIILFVGKTGHFVKHKRNNYGAKEEEEEEAKRKDTIHKAYNYALSAPATKRREALDGKYSIKVNNRTNTD